MDKEPVFRMGERRDLTKVGLSEWAAMLNGFQDAFPDRNGLAKRGIPDISGRMFGEFASGKSFQRPDVWGKMEERAAHPPDREYDLSGLSETMHRTWRNKATRFGQQQEAALRGAMPGLDTQLSGLYGQVGDYQERIKEAGGEFNLPQPKEREERMEERRRLVSEKREFTSQTVMQRVPLSLKHPDGSELTLEVENVTSTDVALGFSVARFVGLIRMAGKFGVNNTGLVPQNLTDLLADVVGAGAGPMRGMAVIGRLVEQGLTERGYDSGTQEKILQNAEFLLSPREADAIGREMERSLEALGAQHRFLSLLDGLRDRNGTAWMLRALGQEPERGPPQNAKETALFLQAALMQAVDYTERKPAFLEREYGGMGFAEAKQAFTHAAEVLYAQPEPQLVRSYLEHTEEGRRLGGACKAAHAMADEWQHDALRRAVRGIESAIAPGGPATAKGLKGPSRGI